MEISGKGAILIPLVLITLACVTGSSAQDADKHLKISLTLAADTLTPGATSEMLLSFTPRKGFHVNAIPPVGFSLDSGAVAALGDTTVVPRDTSTGYLDVRSAVRQPFTMSGSAGRGAYELRGTLTYYYCSDEEGWCRKERQPFALPLIVR